MERRPNTLKAINLAVAAERSRIAARDVGIRLDTRQSLLQTADDLREEAAYWLERVGLDVQPKGPMFRTVGGDTHRDHS